MILQANIAGFNANPSTVLAYLDIQTQTLYIQRTGKLNSMRYKDATIITNQPTSDFEYLFSEQDFKQAFQDYRLYNNGGRLIFEEQAKSAMPLLEVDKITENGTQFAIYGGITNAQIATIALCLLAKKMSEIENSIEMLENDVDEWRIDTI